MNKICVYTCITGNYDNLIEIKTKEEGIDYLCFTNNKKIKSKSWKIIYIDDKNLNDVQLSRKIKILGNDYTEKYDITIWLDGNQYFKKSIHDFLKKFIYNSNTNFIAFKHHSRNSIYQEINACMYFKKETKEKLLNLKKYYLKHGYPESDGLIEASIIIRKNNNDKLLKKTMKMWFKYFLKYVSRDQLLFNYCTYITGMPVTYIDLNIWDNEWTGYYKHCYTTTFFENYRLYFGDSKNFEIEKCLDGKYPNNNLKKELKIIVPCNTNRIEFELSEEVNVILSNMSVKSSIDIKWNVFNSEKVGDKYYFYDKPVILFESDNFLKGDILKFEFILEKINDDNYTQLNSILKKIIYDREQNKNEILELNKKLNDCEFKLKKFENEIENRDKIIEFNEKELKKYKEEFYKVINSKSWRLIQKFQKIKNNFSK
jgi:hypothetical protein